MKRKLMLLMTCLMIGIGLVNAQISKVTGNVTSEEDGLPVVGASVLVKGTTVGTVTDIDGNFTLTNVPSSAGTLVISFIGMQSQEVKVKPIVNVVLKSDAEQLDEVVVTAMINPLSVPVLRRAHWAVWPVRPVKPSSCVKLPDLIKSLSKLWE